MKVIINDCYGGFSVSEAVMKEMGWESPYDCSDRTDPKLIEVVERLGKDANGGCASLRVVEIPEEATDWRLEEYDGAETVWYVLDGKMYSA